MKLNVKERIIILESLPEIGSIAEMRAIKKIKSVLIFTQNEIDELNLINNNGIINWDPSKTDIITIDLDLNQECINVLKEIVKTWDSEKTVTINHLEIIDRIESL